MDEIPKNCAILYLSIADNDNELTDKYKDHINNHIFPK